MYSTTVMQKNSNSENLLLSEWNKKLQSTENIYPNAVSMNLYNMDICYSIT